MLSRFAFGNSLNLSSTQNESTFNNSSDVDEEENEKKNEEFYHGSEEEKAIDQLVDSQNQAQKLGMTPSTDTQGNGNVESLFITQSLTDQTGDLYFEALPIERPSAAQTKIMLHYAGISEQQFA